MKRKLTAALLSVAALMASAQSEPVRFDVAGHEDFKMYVPSEVCQKHGLWKDVEAARDSRMKAWAGKFPTVMTSSHPKSTISFGFNGDGFGIYDIAGPESGKLEIYVDGQMIHLKPTGDARVYDATSFDGERQLDLRTEGRELGYALINVAPGNHQVTLKISEEEGVEKAYLMLGRVLVRGNIAECRPVKGLPKMAQQLKWEDKINRYVQRNAEQAALKDATLVVGSSSIELWKSLETDFPGHNVIRRGVSGTKAIDLYNYREQLIAPFSPKRVIIYAGDNELGFKWSEQELMEWLEKLYSEVRRMNPKAEICLVSVKPSPAREKILPKVQSVNKLIKAFADSQPNTQYIDIHTPMLDAAGNIRPELYRKDRLHPSDEGYAIWRDEFAKFIK